MAMSFISLTIAFTVAGQRLLKQGLLDLGPSPVQAMSLPLFIVRALTNYRAILGLGCAVIAALAWIVAVSHGDLSFAYPFMAIAIVLVLALSAVLFGEAVPVTRWVGVAIVAIGLFGAARK
jgi:uncharacterized membrane protein